MSKFTASADVQCLTKQPLNGTAIIAVVGGPVDFGFLDTEGNFIEFEDGIGITDTQIQIKAGTIPIFAKVNGDSDIIISGTV